MVDICGRSILHLHFDLYHWFPALEIKNDLYHAVLVQFYMNILKGKLERLINEINETETRKPFYNCPP